ncbi:MAG: prepilin-type N-terminal cleavage/methylation domain-containing protein, partial [Candidatus Adiutrix sp.]|nr:prepilin-type N-terminal cleavage/methylation domain-containing protein [Candidatus Adiutrix sp.]
MAFKETGRSRPGFTLMELIIAVAIMAVLAMMAVPALMSIVPRFELRAAAKSAQALLQQARLKAAHTNRPGRVVVDCRKHAADAKLPCLAYLETANFDATGALKPDPDTWSKVSGTARDLPRSVTVTAGAGQPVVAANLFLAIYLPDGRLRRPLPAAPPATPPPTPPQTPPQKDPRRHYFKSDKQN